MTIAVMYTTKAVAKRKREKKPGLKRIRTHDLCNAGAVFYQLSYQAIWELVYDCEFVSNIPVEVEYMEYIISLLQQLIT